MRGETMKLRLGSFCFYSS